MEDMQRKGNRKRVEINLNLFSRCTRMKFFLLAQCEQKNPTFHNLQSLYEIANDEMRERWKMKRDEETFSFLM